MNLEVAVFDTRPYDRRFLGASSERIHWQFHEFRLSAQTAASAEGAAVACIFVNDIADRVSLEKLASAGVKLLALRCAGFNNVDLAVARALKIPVVRVPAYSPHAVAEHTLALLLTLSRKTHRAYNRVRELNFSLTGLVGTEIFGKTVGIIGTGKIGRITAQIFRGFEATVLAHDPLPDPEWSARHGVEYVGLPELLGASDIVSLHVPLSPETLHLLNRETLALLRPGALLVNTSRGKLIDTAALVEALKSGHVGGVALDVYEEEEGIFFEDLSGQVLLDDVLSRLLTFPNVVITSHQAFLTQEGLTEIARVTSQNILNWSEGRPFLPGTQL